MNSAQTHALMSADALRQYGWAAALCGFCVVVAALSAATPWLAAGLVFGAALFALTMMRPLLIVGAMLVIGPIDLSFLTGGFKGLLEEQGGLDMNGIRLIGIVVALSAIAAADTRILRHALGTYGRWYLLFLVYAAVTVLVSSAPLDGLRLLLKMAYPFLIGVAVLGVVASRDDLDKLVSWALGGAAVITLLLIPILLILGQYVVDQGRIRIPAVGVHQNPMSFYLLLMILLSFARFSTRGHYRYLALCIPFAVLIGLTVTRITVLAVLSALVGMALFNALVTRNYRGMLGALVLAIVVTIPLLPFTLERTFGYVPSVGELLALAAQPMELFRAMNWQGREIFWAVILAQFLQHPLFGLGLGSSTAELMANFPVEWGTVVHNEYLRLAAELGIVGLFLVAIIAVTWVREVVRAARRPDPLVREFALPAVAAIVAWAVVSITDNPLDYYSSFTQYVGFFVAGSLAAAARPA
jgi:O-antigen ligase